MPWIKYSLLAIIILIVLLSIGIKLMEPSFYSPDQSIKTYFKDLGQECEIRKIPFETKHIRFVQTGSEDPKKPLIVFVHGAPGNWDAFKSYLSDTSLQKMATLISMDRLGYGSSDRGNAKEDIEPHVEALRNIVEQFDSSKNLILVGHSYGATIVGLYTSLYPSKLRHTIMIAPLNDPDNEPVKWYAKLSNLKIAKLLLPDFINVATVEKMNHSMALEKMRSNWQLIKTPVLHYHGTKDQLAPFEANKSFSHHNIPDSYLRFVEETDGNHLLIWNKFDKIKKLILDTIREL